VSRSQRDNVKDKGGIALIGLSKAGKSTIATVATGHPVRSTQINGLPTLQPVKKLTGEFERLVNSPEMRSITRVPAFFNIKQEFLAKANIHEPWSLIDCPGFEDSAGVEVEVSNRISTIEAMQQASNIKLVVVINANNIGAKGEPLRNLAETVSCLSEKYESIKEGISFVFNQFSE